MPIGGHPPGIDRGFGLLICAACRAGDHPSCKPFAHQRRLTFCECPGWDGVGAFPTVLPCLDVVVHDVVATPPAYTEFIGRQLVAVVQERRVAA